MPGLGIAIVLLIGYVATVGKEGATNLAAYAARKEPPAIEKFRTRHREKDEKAKRKLDAPRKSGGKEPGPLRKTMRAVADNAAAEIVDRYTQKSKARRKWLENKAPEREQQWQAKWDAKLNKRDQKVAAWARKHDQTVPGQLADDTDEQPDQTPEQTPEQPTDGAGMDQYTTDQPPVYGNAFQVDPEAKLPDGAKQLLRDAEQSLNERLAAEKKGEQPWQNTDSEAGADSAGMQEPQTTGQPPAPSAAAFTTTTRTPTTASGDTVYEQAATELRESAEEIRTFCQEMQTFADRLGDRGFGPGITSAAGELATTLEPAADAYGDLADDVQAQGDAVAGAYEQAPDIPKDAAMA